MFHQKFSEHLFLLSGAVTQRCSVIKNAVLEIQRLKDLKFFVWSSFSIKLKLYKNTHFLKNLFARITVAAALVAFFSVVRNYDIHKSQIVFSLYS